jgi:hypothetical protein
VEKFGEARIQHKLAAEASDVATVFIFLLAATGGQVDIEDTEDAALRPEVLLSKYPIKFY